MKKIYQVTTCNTKTEDEDTAQMLFDAFDNGYNVIATYEAIA